MFLPSFASRSSHHVFDLYLPSRCWHFDVVVFALLNVCHSNRHCVGVYVWGGQQYIMLTKSIAREVLKRVAITETGTFIGSFNSFLLCNFMRLTMFIYLLQNWSTLIWFSPSILLRIEYNFKTYSIIENRVINFIISKRYNYNYTIAYCLATQLIQLWNERSKV